MSERIIFEEAEGIARLTLNRPEKLNALDPDMLATIDGHLRRVDTDPGVRVLIVTGAGERAFCVGADITVWSAVAPLEMWRSWVRVGSAVFDRLARLRVPAIAALNGYTFGGGLELALACDLRIAVNNAEFASPEVKIGTVPGWGGTGRLADAIGGARAKQMIFTGERIGTDRAEAWGLINEAVAAADFQDHVTAIARSIAANAPVSVQLAKAAIDGHRAGADVTTLEALAGALAATTGDGREGITAFREKRSPTFTGE